MAENTLYPIAKTRLTTTATSISISNIPSSFDDLVLFTSLRSDRSGFENSSGRVKFNSSTTNYAWRQIVLVGTTPGHSTDTTRPLIYIPSATATTSVFSNDMLYISKYATTSLKTFQLDNGFAVNNGTNSYMIGLGGYWNDTATIDTITIDEANSANFLANSTMYLYGIKRT